MANLKRKRLSLSKKYKAITEVESGTKPLKVAKVLTSPLIVITKRVQVKNLAPAKKFQHWRYLQL